MIDSYDKMPLGKYAEVLRVCEDKSLDDLQRQVAFLAVLLDVTEDEVMEMPITDYSTAARSLRFLEDAPTPSGRKIGSTYKIGGQTFKACTSIGDMTAAQYIDFQSYAADTNHRLPEICSVFLVPKGMSYNQGYDIAEIHRLFREQLTVTAALDLCAFFLTRYTASIKGLLIYSRWAAMRKKDKARKAELMQRIAAAEALLRNAGDGLRMLTRSARRAGALGTTYGR